MNHKSLMRVANQRSSGFMASLLWASAALSAPVGAADTTAASPAACSISVSTALDQWQQSLQLADKQQRLSQWFASAPELELRRYQSQGSRFATQEREVALSVLMHNPWNQASLADGAAQRQAQSAARQQVLRWQSAGMLLQLQQQLEWAREQQRQLQQQLAPLTALAQQLSVALRQQEAVRLDLLQVQQQQSKLQLQLEQQRLVQQTLTQQLTALTDSRVAALPNFQGYCFTPPRALPQHIQQLVQHPLWRAAQLDADHNAWQLEQAGAWQAQPWQVSLQLRQQQADPMLPVDQQVGISVRIPLGGSRHTAQYAESERQASQSNSALVAAQQTLQQQWQSALLQWQQAQLALEAAPAQQQRARQTLDIVSAAFQARELSLSDFLRLQQQAFVELANAEQAQLQLTQAQARLAHAGGFLW